MYSGSTMRALPAAAALLGAVAWLFSACSPEKQHYVPNSLGGDLTPTMATADVTTLISDSGYTRYKVVTPLWQMFEDAEEPFWRFPDGIELEQYDHDMNPESNVVCDSAVYLSRKRIWQLDGNVVMVNTLRDSFLTQQLFWDQTKRKMYTDSFIHIVRSDRTIEGYGFESDQNMLWYSVRKPTAILPANSMPGGRRNAADSAVAESAAPDSARAVSVRRSSAAATAKPAPADEQSLEKAVVIEDKEPRPVTREKIQPVKRKAL